MQFILMTLCLLGVSPDGNVNDGVISNWSPVDMTIEFTVLETWNIDWSANCLGLTTWESGSTVNIVFSSSSGNELNSLDPATGGSTGAIPKPSGSLNGFGVAFNNNLTTPIWHINSWQSGDLFYTEDQFSTWQTIANPCGTGGRGMSYDGEAYWQNNTTSLVRFIPGGTSQTFTDMAPTQISGVAVVPGPTDDTYVMVTTYNTNTFILYSYDGTSMTQVATGVNPAGLGNTNRLGLTWCDSRSSLFFSYAVSSGYEIAELQFDVVSLSRDTWAGIKTSF